MVIIKYPDPLARISIHEGVIFVILLSMLSIFCSCTSSVTIVVSVAGIPSLASSIDAMISLDGNMAHELLRMPMVANRPFTFGFHLPSDSICKSVIVSVAVSDAAGCRLAVGDSPNTMLNAIYDDGFVPVEVTPQLLSIPDCSNGNVAIVDVSPGGISTAGTDLDDKPAIIELSGWGFRSGAVVKFDGLEAQHVEVVSGTRVRAQMPDTNGSLNSFVKIDIVNPASDQDSLVVIDGTSNILIKNRIESAGMRNNLLRYTSLGHFKFDVLNKQQGSVSTQDLSLITRYNIDINKDGHSDIIELADMESPTLPGVPFLPAPFRALSLYLVDHNGRIGQRIRVSLPGAGISPGSLGTGIADLDNDRDVDIFTLVSTMNVVTPWRLVALINNSN